MEEVHPAVPENHMPLEHLHLDPKLTSLIGGEADDADRKSVV